MGFSFLRHRQSTWPLGDGQSAMERVPSICEAILTSLYPVRQTAQSAQISLRLQRLKIHIKRYFREREPAIWF
jgi:hypothetical protein